MANRLQSRFDTKVRKILCLARVFNSFLLCEGANYKVQVAKSNENDVAKAAVRERKRCEKEKKHIIIRCIIIFLSTFAAAKRKQEQPERHESLSDCTQNRNKQ